MAFEAGDNIRAPRVAVTLEVLYRFDAREEFRSGKGTELSTSGVFVQTGERRPVGAMVLLRLLRADGSAVAEGFGRVAWVREEPEGQRGMGLQFIHLDERSMGLVEEMIAVELATVRK